LIEDIIDREIDRHPHNRNLLAAFRPLMVARRRIQEHLQLSNPAPIRLDDTRLRGGAPVIKQGRLFSEDDPFDDLAAALIPPIVEGFPDLREDLQRFSGLLRKKKISLAGYFRGSEDARRAALQFWSDTYAVPQAWMVFVLRQIARIILEKRRAVLAEQLANAGWDKGYCPVCGSFPSLAVIGEKIGERRLHCADCGHDWLFSRVICPYCGHEGQEGMNFFLIEDRPQEAAFTCDRCRRYLVTLNRVSDLNERDLDVSAMGLIHLDLIMQEKGFIPMTGAEEFRKQDVES